MTHNGFGLGEGGENPKTFCLVALLGIWPFLDSLSLLTDQIKSFVLEKSEGLLKPVTPLCIFRR
jgi:hypothetical protein